MNTYNILPSKTVIIDNYDSFTYNLVHIINDLLEGEVDVIRNDQFQLDDIDKYDYIILSPGPGIPDEAGLLKQVIARYASSKKIFGVCLGLQAIGEVFGGKLKNLTRVFHGVKTNILTTDIPSPLFEGISSPFTAGRYHSWVLDNKSNLEAFHITAVDEEGEIMALKHKEYEVHAVQFHPESIMTEEGVKMISNFFKIK
jgi:anthranilate synthase component 2